MARRFAPLPRTAKTAARREALRLFVAPDDTPLSVDLDMAEIELEHRLRMSVGSMWLSLAVSLAVELLKWWLRNRKSQSDFVPQSVFVAGEPGTEDDD